MMRTLAAMGCIALVSMLAPEGAFGQPGAARPSFDIADVHPSPRADWVKNSTHVVQGGYLSGDRYELRRATMLDMIKVAYNIDADKVYGGPSWLDYDRFEVVAKTAPGTSPETLRRMLQTLLADRFGLVAKPGTQPVPGYILSKAKGDLKLKPAGATGDAGCRSTVMVSLVSLGSPGERSILCHDVTMESFATTLGRALSSPVANFSVVNSTGLEGTWDLDLHYSEQPATATGSKHPLVADELAKLGLALELGTIPQPVLTVEKANELPSPNPPGAPAALPPRPQPEFEVATVRLANGESGGSRALLFQAGGRVTASGMPPGILIQQAWNLSSYEQIVGLPKSFSGTIAHNITIVAKAPEGWFPAAPGTANAQARDMLYGMLRSLLIDRYKMTFHFEDRPTDAPTLTANKPKLTKADTANRTGCKRESQQQQGMALIVKLACRNITMQQFAEQMPSFDTGIWYPVEDATGLEGAWDFTLTFDALSRLGNLTGRGGPPPSDGAIAEASDPSGSVSFLDAVQKQLG
ncbi:MAG: TIGR03435 family protein, partial [Bryobacteraceae bacterium]